MDFKSVYFPAWKTAWDYHKKWCSMQGTDEYWDAWVDEAGQLIKQFGDKPFVKDLVLAVISEMERVQKMKEKEQVKDEQVCI